MLSFKHEVFLEVARNLSFTKAASSLFISQPAITNHIKQLEDDYQVSLFERKANSILLTYAGKLLVQSLQQVKEVERRFNHEIQTYQKIKSTKGELKLGASTTVALYIIPPVLSAFRKKFPQAKLSLFNRNSESVLAALLARDIDLGILEGESRVAQVHCSHFMTDEVIPVCSSQSPLANRKKIPVKDLLTIPVALRERGSGTLQALKIALQQHSLKLSQLKTGVTLGGTEALKNFILADDCLGFLPHRSVIKELSDGSLVRVHIEGLIITRQFYFIQRHGEEALGFNASFIQLAKRHYNLK